jgi:hypothetical protein
MPLARRLTERIVTLIGGPRRRRAIVALLKHAAPDSFFGADGCIFVADGCHLSGAGYLRADDRNNSSRAGDAPCRLTIWITTEYFANINGIGLISRYRRTRFQTAIEHCLLVIENFKYSNYLCNIIVMDFGTLLRAGAAVSFRSAIHLQFWSARQLC